MAVSLRELFLIVRAEDHASKQLRMVGGSLRGLAKSTDIAAQSQRLRARADAMQAAMAAKQARIKQFPKEEALMHERRAEALNRLNLAQQSFSQAQGSRQVRELQLNERLARSEAKRIAAIKAAGPIRGAGGRFISQAEAIGNVQALTRAQREQAIAKMDLGQSKLATSVQTANNALARQSLEAGRARSAHEALATSLAVDQQHFADFNREMEHFNKTAPRVARLERVSRAAQGAAALGRTAMFAGGVGAVGLGFAANAAAQLSTQSTLAATQAIKNIDQVGKRTEQVQRGIIAQMQRFPATADEMSQSIYDIFSGTNIQQADKGMRLMALFNQAAVAGQSDLNTATQGGITVMNAYGKSVGDMPHIMNQMFSAVRFGRTNFTDFNNSLNQLVPAFKSANQSINTMFGSLAFLTRRMPSVRMASTSLARATEILGNTKMIEGLHKAGVEIADLHGNLLPLPEVFDRILRRFPGLAKGDNVMNWIKDMSNQQGTIQGRRALVHIFRDFPAYSRMLQQVTGDTNEFDRARKAMMQTPGVQFKIAINQFKALALSIGTDALPAITSLIKPLQHAVHWFDSLSPGVKQATSSFLVWGAAATLVGGALLTFVANAVRAAATLGLLTVAGEVGAGFGTLAAGISLVAEELAAGNIAASLGLMAGGLAALGPLIIPATLLAFAAAVVLLGDDVKTTSDKINDLNNSLDEIAKDPSKNIGKLNDAVAQTSKVTAELHKNTADTVKANTGAGWKGMATLKKATADAKDNMAGLNKVTEREVQLLSQAAEQGRKMSAQQAGRGATTLAASAGLNARQADLTGFISRMTGKLPTAELLGRFQEFGTRAISIVANVAQATHKMMTGHELDQALKLNQAKLIRLFKFVQRHHRLPKWLLEVDTTKGARGVDHLTTHATKLAHKHFKTTFLDGTGPARKGMSVAQAKANALNQKRYQIHFTANTAAVSAGLSGLSDTAFAMGARVADQFLAGMDKHTKSQSPSKEMEKRGKWLIQGLSKGIVKEAGGVQAAFKSIVDTMSSTWTGLHDQLQGSFGTLFGGPRGDIISTIAGFGGRPGIGLLTQDLRAQTHKFSTWMHAVDRLRSMGAPPSLVSQLWELGPDSLPMVQSILAGTKRQRRHYFALARRENRLVTSATQRAFLNQVKEWKNMGKQMAFGILTGLRSVRPELIRFFKGLAHEMFHTFKKHNKSHSPSMLYFQEGRNMMLGLQMGISSVRPAFPGAVGFSGRGRGGGDTHYHYHAPAYNAGTSGNAWMKKSRFDFERHIKGLPR